MNMTVNRHIIELIADNMQRDFGPNVFPCDMLQAAQDRIDPQRVHEQYDVMRRYISGSFQGMKILEIGASYGSYQSFLKSEGAQPYGIEPNQNAIEIGLQIWENMAGDSKVVTSVGEYLPFPGDVFDIVFSSNVLEHVQDPHRVIAEALRVLKIGGFLHFVFPNYGSIWDGHYATFWIPYAPANLMKWYLKLLGRSPHYVDTLQLLNIFTVRQFLKDNPNLKLISLGEDLFCERLMHGISGWSGMNRLPGIIRLLQKFKLVQLTCWLSRLFVMQTPFVLTAVKTF